MTKIMHISHGRASDRARTGQGTCGAGFLKWVVILGFVALGGWAGFLYMGQQSIRSEVAQLQEQNAILQKEKQDLEQKVTQIAKPAEDTGANELVKLRGEVASLRAMKKQYDQTVAENQQLKATVQQMQQANAETATLRNENAQLQTALNAKAFTDQCIMNLRAIAGAKARWALENRKTAIDTPTDVDIFGRYIPQKPACPAGGVYTLGTVGGKTTCTAPGHAY